MLKALIKIANELDRQGLYDLSDKIDLLIKTAAEIEKPKITKEKIERMAELCKRMLVDVNNKKNDVLKYLDKENLNAVKDTIEFKFGKVINILDSFMDVILKHYTDESKLQQLYLSLRNLLLVVGYFKQIFGDEEIEKVLEMTLKADFDYIKEEVEALKIFVGKLNK